MERFEPDKIILFGSYAYGKPHEDSDVDILVVVRARNQLDMAFKIHNTIEPPFYVQVIVRTPHAMEWRLREGDSFLQEIVSKGKILYEKAQAGLKRQITSVPVSPNSQVATPSPKTPDTAFPNPGTRAQPA